MPAWPYDQPRVAMPASSRKRDRAPSAAINRRLAIGAPVASSAVTAAGFNAKPFTASGSSTTSAACALAISASTSARFSIMWANGSRGAPCATSDPTPQAKRRRNRSPRMSSAINDVLDILNLERLEVNLFRGRSPQAGWQRVFGGQVNGQALVAACRTVEGRPPHSLHAYFLLPGDPAVPIIYEVDRIRDGKSFTTRRVVAIQHGQAIFNLSASFHVDEPGPEHQFPMPDVPDPDALPTFEERMAPYRERLGPWYDRPRPIDIRY